MSSSPPGIDTSTCEVTNITRQGFWLLVDDREYFVPFEHYPRFRDATVAQIHTLRRSGSDHIHWPDLDVDIELDALERPESFPLLFHL